MISLIEETKQNHFRSFRFFSLYRVEASKFGKSHRRINNIYFMRMKLKCWHKKKKIETISKQTLDNRTNKTIFILFNYIIKTKQQQKLNK